ncbi:LOW QUALITY PROTEIN: olfactory receptor 8H1-like [Suncus etruscus]|uniref:LOW QUALITY PROTEIN: olfactory receptor 8H1-like n=1 Tax=Suncus etruscus TaxID=109475 RepID=UPI00210F9591|nr:LOW QUALITY PROTEIN: olfactory receptor 8H1-like [Suncus etruscus]
MDKRNNTNISDFIMMGLTGSAEIRLVLFLLFLLIYLITMLGNSGMILMIHLDLQLHTPMYFFLSHLSFLDLSYSTVIIPKSLENLIASTTNMFYVRCFTHLYFFFFVFLGAAECFLLFSMAYDSYVAICNPLQYPVIMSSKFCYSLTLGSYLIGFTVSSVNALCMSRLHFCDSNIIHHFFCDTSPRLAVLHRHTQRNSDFCLCRFHLMVSLITISFSYASILSTILKINSSSGRQKAFYSCADFQSLFYGA